MADEVDIWTDCDGLRITGVHRQTSTCRREGCCIHAPSPHPMRDWPQRFRLDTVAMERICPCGVGHPDPDHLGFIERRDGHAAACVDATHGCCGCCDIEPAADLVVNVDWREFRGSLSAEFVSAHGGEAGELDGWVHIVGSFTIAELGDVMQQIACVDAPEDLTHSLPYWPHRHPLTWKTRSAASSR